MPTIKRGDKVLVTGANGYLPMWVVRQLLERGYSVRGTVRTLAKGAHMKEMFKRYGDKLELVEVPDITVEGAFDEAVKGVDGIAHMASPFHQNVEEPEEFIRPAVHGTVGVLKSALKNNPGLKRIVITSSCAAVFQADTKPRVFSEKDWNDGAIAETHEKGRDAAPMVKYCASKTLAEKAAWKFYNVRKGEINWDLSVINPPYVYGPALQEIPSVDKLNESMALWYNTVLKEGEKPKELLASSNAWVDVRDVAFAHLLALEKEAAGGERIIVASGPYIWQEWVDLTAKLAASLHPAKAKKIFRGYPEITQGPKTYMLDYDLSKVKRVLGLRLRPKEDTIRDLLKFFAERGW